MKTLIGICFFLGILISIFAQEQESKPKIWYWEIVYFKTDSIIFTSKDIHNKYFRTNYEHKDYINLTPLFKHKNKWVFNYNSTLATSFNENHFDWWSKSFGTEFKEDSLYNSYYYVFIRSLGNYIRTKDTITFNGELPIKFSFQIARKCNKLKMLN
ncbi:MAG: hypothetical protein A2W91_15735 [Bacteroidetes bacterium GWF2_38_335]|nr:MAG: hypothetical protein A2W91_15735 [Bacteroidetes bacterium GWF2_38_335]OFY81473.1 MAG: hypothetical protein A2281_13410 [Bacteroidetes bacterium RIFOXYA12_FULL_38_20]